MRSETVKLAVGSLPVGVIVLGLKYLAYWFTGSVALYSDALASIVNVDRCTRSSANRFQTCKCKPSIRPSQSRVLQRSSDRRSDEDA